ncbi:hypothetical protein TrVE_jg5393 [Triparma verrucosa]|uniref:Ribosomal protein L9 domain-containing protein n=1 Tax=Triparma verrucosa TaxID=1606542 RepID=A0A9W7B122_9STRA|nr:hypothetical protein TrVE_jg5393 [Triparma verrucosa]
MNKHSFIGISSLARSSSRTSTLSTLSTPSTLSTLFSGPVRAPIRIPIRAAHTVRVVLKENNDSKVGKGLAGDIVTVKAGYMRNYLYQQKIAVYATPHNIKTYARSTDSEEDLKALKEAEEEEKKAMEGGRALTGAEIGQHAVLEKYMKGKVLKIKRQAVDNESDKILKADSVNDGVLRKKLSKQMKLVLEDTESLEIPKDVDLSALGDFECKIVLESGLKVPFNVSVVRR